MSTVTKRLTGQRSATALLAALARSSKTATPNALKTRHNILSVFLDLQYLGAIFRCSQIMAEERNSAPHPLNVTLNRFDRIELNKVRWI